MARSHTNPPLRPAVDWDLERLQKEWNLWDEKAKDHYLYWFDLAKEMEDQELGAARFAAHKVLEMRRRDGTRESTSGD